LMQMLTTTAQTALDPGSARVRPTALTNAGPEALPDLLLIERARAGDERAVEALIRRYSRRLYRVASSVLMDEMRAEGAVIDAFLAAFGDLARYEPSGKFAAWLTRLAFMQARTLRGSGRALAPATPSVERVSASAPTVGDDNERRELQQAIAALPEVFRTVYVLRVVEGISGIETAASLGLHETTVRTRLYRAHRRLPAGIGPRIRTACARRPSAHGCIARTGACPRASARASAPRAHCSSCHPTALNGSSRVRWRSCVTARC
jgi:RNA polymerase sigma-70 factor, ECF subfamily